MIQEYENAITPSLFLRRLIVTSNGSSVYDEKFHTGLNIIRGINGTGKTTIADFIFYGLGGENINWKDEALLCDYVFCEIFVSGVIWTTRRVVEPEGKVGTDIFEGSYETAISSPNKWKHYPMARREAGKNSYSQLLFSQLGIPEVKEEQDNLTIHKILRALYIDQASPMQFLMYADTWDTAIIRAMIGDVLFGVYSPALFEALVKIRELTEDDVQKKRELKSLKTSLSDAGFLLSVAQIQAKIREIDKLFDVIPGNEGNKEDFFLEQSIADLNEKLSLTLMTLNDILFEYRDSDLFIISLNEKLKQIEQSLATREYLKKFKIDTCPICLSNIDSHADGDNKCYLCHNDIKNINLNSSLIRIREEIKFQIQESQKLQSKRSVDIENLKSKVVEIKSDITSRNKIIKDKVAIRASNASNTSMQTIIEKAQLIAERKELEKNISLVEKLSSVEDELKHIHASLNRYSEVKYQVEGNQKRQKDKIFRDIDETTRIFLKADTRYEHEFITFGKVELNFPKNTFSLDGKHNFSASSVVYLKNSICFSMFFASLKNDFMYYPRFILCDNTEDKGMQPERSHAFQRTAAKLSSRYQDIPHQIILTTSMIADDMNIPEYTIGHFFTEENMALQFPKNNFPEFSPENNTTAHEDFSQQNPFDDIDDGSEP